MTRPLALALLLLAACPQSLLAQDPEVPDGFAPVHELITKGIAAGEAPSVSVAVIQDNRLTWIAAYGLADVEKKIQATPNSIYLLASVSKPLLATGLMKLVDDGKISLDKPINDYLGQAKVRSYTGDAKRITVRTLANHTSGLPVHWNFYYNGVEPPDRDETIRRHGFTFHSPGANWEYSNLAFGILDHAITRQAGKPWGKFLEEAVFDPAGMSRTSDRVRSGLEKDATRQYTHDVAGRLVPVSPYRFDHDGASACWSSAPDLARFLLLHLNDGQIQGTRVLTTKSARAMRVATAYRPSEISIGNGVAWFVARARGHDSFYHGGGMPGVATHIRGFPESRSGLVVLTNSSNRKFKDAVVDAILLALFPKKGKVNAMRQGREDETLQSEFAGAWRGIIRHPDGDIPTSIDLPAEGDVAIRFGKQPQQTLQDVKVRTGKIVGRLTDVRLATQLSYHGLVDLDFELSVINGKLIGRATARAQGYFALSYLVELQRKPKR